MNDSIQENYSDHNSGNLANIFAKINMSELPAMSPHVQELISLAYDNKAGANELADVILKDYSLTNKVLQVVNSAYYGLGHQVSSISRAVTILGFDAVRNMATAVAIFEDFVKSGVEKEGVSKLITRSFLSGIQARSLAEKKKLGILPEEAFICSLLHNLGKIVVCLYLPDLYRELEQKIESGSTEEEAAWEVFDGLDLRQIGVEVARFWNMSEKVVASMEFCPLKPLTPHDEMGYLKSIADFTNTMVDDVCVGHDIEPLIDEYAEVFGVDLAEAIELLKDSLDEAVVMSKAIRYGLGKLKIKELLDVLERDVTRLLAFRKKEAEQAAAEAGEISGKLDMPESAEGKTTDDFVKEIMGILMGPFELKDIYSLLAEGLFACIGFDRVVLALLKKNSAGISLGECHALGDINADALQDFETQFFDRKLIIPQCLVKGKDVAVPPDTSGTFNGEFEKRVKGRTVYLLPITLHEKSMGLIYLDRKKGRLKLNAEEIKKTRLFRDIAEMALKKIRARH
ncbi:MAG: HDOD domain-containing protein [Proteobacteria bacterium]|nr:HDOD domain-containing protein [Pseudomonadota bacterium]MBU1716294.1 HDOD domain-containing protein [Pseudomonadota bacterium]